MTGWEIFKHFSTRGEAIAEAEFLRNNQVPTRVEFDEPIPGMLQNACIYVPAELLHRARWVMAQQADFTDQELSVFALDHTGDSEQKQP